MTLVFDAANVRFDQYVMLLIPGTALLLTLFIALRGGKRKSVIIGGCITAFLFLLTVLLPIADHQHVRAALTDGSAKTAEGVISAHKRETMKRWTGSARGVGISSFNSYTSSTSEQFFVGQQWFWLRVGGFPSGASFTNAADPPLPLNDGTWVRVTWFNDPWNGDETRILRLEIDQRSATQAPRAAPAGGARMGQPVAASTSGLPADFAAFWKGFSAAAASGDSAGVRALTRFPFLFAGTPVDAARFSSIWMGIFPEPLRPCFATATPVKDGDAWSLSCGAYVYMFEKGASGWQFTDFTADPEAE
jgi:hypothetical protein